MTLLGYSVPETLTNDAGKAQKGKTLAVTGPNAYAGVVVSDATDGVFRLGPLPAGMYTVTYGDRSVDIPVYPTPTDLQAGYDAAVGAAPSSSLTSEAAARAAADSAESSARAAADAAESALRATGDSNEANTRAAADAAATAAQAAATALEAADHAAEQTAIGNEATARAAAVTAEQARATAAEAALTANLSSEIARATAAEGTKAQGLVPTALKTSAYTAGAADLVLVDTTSAGVTVTLPTAPADKTRIAVKHVVQGGANAVTIAAGGTDRFNTSTGPTSATLPLLNQAVQLQYVTGSPGRWIVSADDIPLSQLDLRYLTPTTAAGTYGPFALARSGWTVGLADALAEGSESCALHTIGDSTGYTSGKTRWTDLLASWVAATYPAYGVQTVRWDDATQTYLTPTTVQAQPLGARYAALAGKSLTHPGDGTVMNGKVEFEIDLSFNNPTTNVISTLIARAGGTAGTKQFEWILKLTSMEFRVSTDGTNWLTKYNTTTGQPMPAAGTRIRYRARFTPDNGSSGSSVSFWYSNDNGVNWTQIGSTWTNAFLGTANQSNLVGWEAGGETGGTTLDGRIYGVWVRNGFSSDSPPAVSVVPESPDLWSGWSTPSPTMGGSPMFTLVNGSIAGKNVAYFNASAARVASMTPVQWGSRALVLNSSHNDQTDTNANPGNMTGAPFLALWDSWLTAIRARLPHVPIAVTIQNPRTSPATYIEAHRARSRNLREWAFKNSLGLIDVRRAFVESSTVLSSLVDSTDGIHPSDATGSPLWASLVESHITARA